MEALDTEKLKEILEMMKANGAVFLKFNDLIIEFNRADKCSSDSTDAIGFDAQGTPEETKKPKTVIRDKPVGYTALFGDKTPTFPRPSAEGKHA